MKRRELLITIQKDRDVFVLYKKTFKENIITSRRALHGVLCILMPDIPFVLDDGSDEKDSDYCQYIYYPIVGDKSTYILAAYNEREI